jgi:hypothetical protein
VPGFLSNVAHHFPRKIFQGDGKRNSFDRKNRKMYAAAVTGTSLFTGNLLGIRFLNPATNIFDLIN